MQPNQELMFNDEELSLFRNTFAENDELLKMIRKVFLQYALTNEEKGAIRQSCTPAVLELLRKRILPEPKADAGLGQTATLLFSLNDALRSKTPEEMYPQFKAKSLEIDYIAQQFEVLEAIATEGEIPEQTIWLDDLEFSVEQEWGVEEAFINMTAYLFLLTYVDQSMLMVKALAGSKAETIEEQKKRLTRNSSK